MREFSWAGILRVLERAAVEEKLRRGEPRVAGRMRDDDFGKLVKICDEAGGGA